MSSRILLCLVSLCSLASLGCAASETGPRTAKSTPSAIDPDDGSEPSREQRALAFFQALQTGQPDNVTPFLIAATDCDYLEKLMKIDDDAPVVCRAKVEEFRAMIGDWLPKVATEAKDLTPTGVKFEPLPMSGLQDLAYMVTIETKEATPFLIAGYNLKGEYRFAIPLKQADTEQ